LLFENLKETRRGGSGILDTVPHGKGNETDIAGLKIEGARLAGRSDAGKTHPVAKSSRSNGG
jgi:hypothetical protein